MSVRVMLGLALAAVAVVATAYAADEIKLDGIKCVVAAKNPAKAENFVAYKGGKAFFCCMNCPKAFEKDTAKFATSANFQLAATKQAKQIACPFSGEAVDPAQSVKVGDLEVSFCCGMCKGKAEAADDKLALIFADKAFDKGFKVPEKK
jgi:hypothetical protein